MFFSEILVSPKRRISELMAPGFGRPMQLLMGDVVRFRCLGVYMRDDFPAYRPRNYECDVGKP